MEYKTLTIKIPVPTLGLSAGDVERYHALINQVLATIADQLEAASEWHCAPSIRHAIAAVLRGDPELRRDA